MRAPGLVPFPWLCPGSLILGLCDRHTQSLESLQKYSRTRVYQVLALELLCWDAILWSAPSIFWPFEMEARSGMQTPYCRIIRWMPWLEYGFRAQLSWVSVPALLLRSWVTLGNNDKRYLSIIEAFTTCQAGTVYAKCFFMSYISSCLSTYKVGTLLVPILETVECNAVSRPSSTTYQWPWANHTFHL